MSFLENTLNQGLVIIAFLAIFSTVQAQPEPYFEMLGIEDGLYDLDVKSICQDSLGYIWFGTESGGLSRYDGNSIQTFQSNPNHPNNNYPRALTYSLNVDEEGYIWTIGETPRGLFRINPYLQTVDHYPIEGHSFSALLDKKGRIWVGSYDQGLLRIDKENKAVLSFIEEFDQTLKTEYVRNLLEDHSGNLWFSYPHKVYKWNETTRLLSSYDFPKDPKQVAPDFYFEQIFEDSKKNIWVATSDGLFLLDPKTSEFQAFNYDPTIQNKNIGVSSIGEDKEGFLWIGDFQGLYILDMNKKQGKRISASHKQSEALKTTRTIFCDRNGNMWIGTFRGLLYWNRYRKTFHPYSIQENSAFENPKSEAIRLRRLQVGDRFFAPKELSFDPGESLVLTVKSFAVKEAFFSTVQDNQGNFWVPSYDDGLHLFDSTGKFLKRFGTNNSSLPTRASTTAFVDQKGVVWIGNWGYGLYRYIPENQTFLKHPVAHPNQPEIFGRAINVIHEDKQGYLWLGCNDYDLIQLNPDRTVKTFYPISTTDLVEDQNGVFWIASRDGLYKFNSQTGDYDHWTQQDGLPSGIVNSILMDEKGHLWLGTLRGLSHFDPNTETFHNYDLKDGLPDLQFSKCHGLKSRTGEFYFGLQNGMFRFHPNSIKNNPVIPKVIISDLKIRNQSVPIKGTLGDTLDSPSPLDQHISFTKDIRLNWRQNDISISFTAITYLNAQKNQYKYRLNNYDREWNFVSAQNPHAVYTNLNPGKYRFQVTASNNDGLWNETGASLYIIITPPWWATWWAYCIYGMLILSILYGLRAYELNRKLANYEAGRLRELNQVKSRLYTNITHEFRTPLSIILGISGQIKKEVEAKIEPHLEMIEKNGRQLLRLVNQLLDLSKVDSGTFALNYQRGDIVNYLKYLIESFHSLAEQKAIQLHFLSDLDSLFMDYDQERLQQIFNNLLSNALKFTKEGGHIYVQLNQLSEQELEVKFKDTGVGIPEDQLAKIFDRFYQLDDSETRRAEGTGIGLALVKELIQLMDGNIIVKSKPGKGTEFIMNIPIHRNASINSSVVPAEIPLNGMENANLPMVSNSLEGPKVLVIEDNKDVQFYIQNCLSVSYQVETAFDGQEGIQKAQKIIPDMIICDVMMPLKDGFEVCETLKADTRTSHIPIVMLTAKADFDSKLKGLKHGANVYLSKPFQEEELLLNLHNLLLQRQRLQQHYLFLSGLNKQPDSDQLEENLETDFVECVKAKILDHLTDSSFTVSQLSREMALSPSHLHRKLTALTGYSASKMIRMIRLNHAKKLLQNPALTVASVAYDSGFNDPDYLSKVFKQEYGITPTEFRRRQKEWSKE